MNKKISEDSVVVVTGNQVSSDLLDGEIIVLDIHEGAYYVLNPVAARIWTLIQTPKQVADLVEVLIQEYEVASDRCTREVIHWLRDFASRKLVKVENGAR